MLRLVMKLLPLFAVLVLQRALAGPQPALAQLPGPAADKITFTSVAVDVAPAALERGDIDIYLFSIKTLAAKELAGKPGFKLYQAPASMVSILLNPAPAPAGQLNPFAIREFRFALQFLVNRPFVVSEIYKGLAAPMLTHVSPFDYDYLIVFDLIREMGIRYDPDLAKRTITEAMTKAGAERRDGQWYYKGSPVAVRFVIRVEDERREVGDSIASELEKAGFRVIRDYQTFGPAIRKVYGTDPASLEWHLYTEGWAKGAAERYDFATINQMSAPWFGNMPGWQELGFWQYRHDRLDELGQRIFKGEFKSLEERNALYREMTKIALEESVRIWVASVVNNFPARAGLEGITEDVASGLRSVWTLREARAPGRAELRVGNVWVWTPRTTWNPVGGFRDVYSVDIWRNVVDPALARHPFTGTPVPFRAAFSVETAGPEGKLEVPPDALIWDARKRAWVPVGPGVRATSKVVFDYSKYFASKWHHGEPITPADLVYSLYQAFDLAYSESKPKVEFAIAMTSRPYLDTFRGFRLTGRASLEVYVDFWHFDKSYIAEYASVAGMPMPWEVLYAMDTLVFEKRRAAYSDTAAERFGVPWLNLVLEKDARMVRAFLLEAMDKGMMPTEALTFGRPLAGQEEAMRRYRAAIRWFDAYKLMVISNGPYKLVRFDTAAQFAELDAFRDESYPFRKGDMYHGSAKAIRRVSVGGTRFEPGSFAAITVELTGPGRLGLKYMLVDPATGRVIAKGDAKQVGPGRFLVELPPDLTAKIVGSAQLVLLAYSDELSIVLEGLVDVGPAAKLEVVEEARPEAAVPLPWVFGALVAIAAAGAFLVARRRLKKSRPLPTKFGSLRWR